MTSDIQDAEGGIYHLRGHVVVELNNATFKADEVDYDENTKIFKARGHVSYRNYERNEILYCDRAEYNSDTERGTFYHVRGYSKTKVDARPGLLVTQEPFYFEGRYAEKFEDKYLLHDGFVTDCKVPNPWWTLRSPLFDIIPDNRAITRNSIFRVRGIPLFYFPYFYKALEKRPRKSGFLTPNIGNSSRRGLMFGVGYYWAINRSMDVTYRVQDFTERGFAHHIDFRGKPTQTSDFDVIFLGVDDRGVVTNGVLDKAPGVSIYGVGRTDLGGGWTGRATINYLSSLKFRQEFTESFNEAIFSESISVGYLTKHFDAYTINVAFSRIENFQDATPDNSVVIRKLPEVEFEGRDQQIAGGPVPAWFSFESSFGLLHRVQPEPNGQKPPGFYETSQFSTRADIEPALTTAFHWRGFSLVPSFILHETFYGQSFLNGAVTSNNLLRSAPELFIDFTTPALERIFDRKTFLGDKLKHVIEPRFNYRYVTGIENFDKVIRFDDLDLLSNTNEVEIGIINRLYAKRRDSVNEIFTWELYQKRFFDPTFGGVVIPGQRNVVLSTIDLTGYAFLDQPRSYSPIASILRASPRPGVGIQWQLDYDPLRGGVVNSMFSADARIKRYFFAAGHNQVRSDPVLSPPANQVRGIFGYGDPNRKGWSAAFSAVYDYRIGELQFATTQVSYNTDCCGISFQFRRFNFGSRNENQFRVAFAISNVGTFGTLKKQERLF